MYTCCSSYYSERKENQPSLSLFFTISYISNSPPCYSCMHLYTYIKLYTVITKHVTIQYYFVQLIVTHRLLSVIFQLKLRTLGGKVRTALRLMTNTLCTTISSDTLGLEESLLSSLTKCFMKQLVEQDKKSNLRRLIWYWSSL